MIVELDFADLAVADGRRMLRSFDLSVRQCAGDSEEWIVENQKSGAKYSVVRMRDGYACGCYDWNRRLSDCKHILAVRNVVDYE